MKRLKNNRGFTLVEVIVSMAILGIVVVPFGQIFISSIRTNMEAKKVHRATLIAQQYTEKVKVINNNKLGTVFDVVDISSDPIVLKKTVVQGGTTYEVESTLSSSGFGIGLPDGTGQWDNQDTTLTAIPTSNTDDISITVSEPRIDIIITKEEDNTFTVTSVQGIAMPEFKTGLISVPRFFIYYDEDIKDYLNNIVAPVIEVTNTSNETAELFIIKKEGVEANVKVSAEIGTIKYNQYFDINTEIRNEKKVYKLTTVVTSQGKEYARITTTRGER